jgi:hypothetical protein
MRIQNNKKAQSKLSKVGLRKSETSFLTHNVEKANSSLAKSQKFEKGCVVKVKKNHKMDNEATLFTN